MAIQKEVETEYGIEFKYHKITDVRISTVTGETQLIMTVASYLDKNARINNKDAVYHECCIVGADFALTPFYKLLKAKFPDFQDAEDDYDNAFKEQEDIEADDKSIRYIQHSNGTNVKSWEDPTKE